MYNWPGTYMDQNCFAPCKREPEHIHAYEGITSCVNDHDHKVKGYTSEGIAYGNSHIHFYKEYTCVSKKHKHKIFGYTGPAVPTNDGHIHCMRAADSYVCDHYHNYLIWTCPEKKVRKKC